MRGVTELFDAINPAISSQITFETSIIFCETALRPRRVRDVLSWDCEDASI